ncbi:MAG: hypothetical protein D6707_01850 [Bacteroidetes bacterium]|nr:MAG: hypothetical protein D6707_01850 [Bacteroidota bacterium]
MKKLSYLILFSFLFPVSLTYAQKSELFFHYGFIFPHRKGVNHLIKRHVPAMEFNWFLQKYDENKQWYYQYNYPEKGIGMMWFDFGNPQQLGYGLSVYPFWNFYFSPNSATLLSFKSAAGIGWVTKPFREETNYKNILIGSYLNAFIHFALNCRLRLSDRIFVSTGISFSHFSNGAYRMPNLGMNIPAIKAGMLVNIGEKNEYPVVEEAAFKKSKYFNLMINGGVKEIYPLSRRKFPVMSLNVNYNWNYTPKSIVSAGLDLYHNSSYKTIFENDSTMELKNYIGIEPSVVLGFGKIFGKTQFQFQTGFYLYTYLPRFMNMYQRISIRREIIPALFFDLSLKSHLFVADYIGFGIVYNWKHE